MEWWGYLLTAAGAMATIAAGVAGIKTLFKPLTDISKRVADLERHDKCDIERFEQIEKRFEQFENSNQVVLISLHAILSHLKTNNNTGEMDKALKELVKHIVRD